MYNISTEKGGVGMLAAVKGIVRGNTVIIEDEDMRDYDGAEVVVTLLDNISKEKKRTGVDLKQFVIPTERGQRADEYVRELRDHDRI